jgi:hypothetical protein
MKTDKLLQEDGEGGGVPVTNTGNAGNPLILPQLPIKPNTILSRYKDMKKKRKSNDEKS